MCVCVCVTVLGSCTMQTNLCRHDGFDGAASAEGVKEEKVVDGFVLARNRLEHLLRELASEDGPNRGRLLPSRDGEERFARLGRERPGFEGARVRGGLALREQRRRVRGAERAPAGVALSLAHEPQEVVPVVAAPREGGGGSGQRAVQRTVAQHLRTGGGGGGARCLGSAALGRFWRLFRDPLVRIAEVEEEGTKKPTGDSSYESRPSLATEVVELCVRAPRRSLGHDDDVEDFQRGDIERLNRCRAHP
mmetsp:Transcript_24083/g.78434  ORF Transcript_24083/g.78434 Transcript_24083/m.78434 type:complete len:249 (+) Transcript_24083:919-1665(+)